MITVSLFPDTQTSSQRPFPANRPTTWGSTPSLEPEQVLQASSSTPGYEPPRPSSAASLTNLGPTCEVRSMRGWIDQINIEFGSCMLLSHPFLPLILWDTAFISIEYQARLSRLSQFPLTTLASVVRHRATSMPFALKFILAMLLSSMASKSCQNSAHLRVKTFESVFLLSQLKPLELGRAWAGVLLEGLMKAGVGTKRPLVIFRLMPMFISLARGTS